MYPELFNEFTSNLYFKALTEHVAWKQEPVKIMGQEIIQPRLTAWYGDEGKSYSYTGITMNPLPWSMDLLKIKEAVQRISGELFNSALLNLYRDGSDSVGWHRDNEKSLGSNPVIGSVSFGVSRVSSLKHYKDKNLKVKVLLTNGSLLFWLHQKRA